MNLSKRLAFCVNKFKERGNVNVKKSLNRFKISFMNVNARTNIIEASAIRNLHNY